MFVPYITAHVKTYETLACKTRVPSLIDTLHLQIYFSYSEQSYTTYQAAIE